MILALCTTALSYHVDCCDSCLVLLPLILSSMLTLVSVQQINWLIRDLQRNVDRGHFFDKAALVHKIRKCYLYLRSKLGNNPAQGAAEEGAEASSEEDNEEADDSENDNSEQETQDSRGGDDG